MIPPSLINVFRATEYRIWLPDPLILRIGQHCAELLALHAQHGIANSAILTAFNPNSQIAAAQDNQTAQQRLQQAIDTLGYTRFSGENIDPKGEWPVEPTILVLGISRSQAMLLLQQFQQTACVFTEQTGTPKVLLADGSIIN